MRESNNRSAYPPDTISTDGHARAGSCDKFSRRVGNVRRLKPNRSTCGSHNQEMSMPHCLFRSRSSLLHSQTNAVRSGFACCAGDRSQRRSSRMEGDEKHTTVGIARFIVGTLYGSLHTPFVPVSSSPASIFLPPLRLSSRVVRSGAKYGESAVCHFSEFEQKMWAAVARRFLELSES